MEILSKTYDTLNRQQQKAVTQRRNTVVLAGPGSGKTATLVVKAAYLLTDVISAPQGLACITYNNEAVSEFRKRLERLNIKGSGRVFLGTVHSFCLNCIIRPFAPLVSASVADRQIGSQTITTALLVKAANEIGPDAHPYDLQETITRLRSRIACGEDYSGFADQDIQILNRYQKLLADGGLLDFEGIVEEALTLVREHPWIREILAARFPWVLVDEYQDLGGPLHRIVEECTKAGLQIFAVGDPDQSIYEFAGAEPAYLTSLSERSEFRTIRLKFNYRSGGRLIAASQAALAPSEPRGYEPDPTNKNEGEILFFNGGLIEEQPAVIVAQVLPELQARMVPLDEIAIFYKRKGPFLDRLVKALTDAEIPFILEKNDKYPRTRITSWLQQAMQAGLELAQGKPTEVDLAELEFVYGSMRTEAGLLENDLPLESKAELFDTIIGFREAGQSLRHALELLDKRLRVSALLASAKVDLFGDRDTWEVLQRETEDGKSLGSYTIGDFSTEGRKQGKLVVTTHHSSKGRQFEAVVIPELVQEVFPAAPWVERQLKQERRLFYVAFTRAKKVVALVHGDQYRKRNNSVKQSGVSQFVLEVHKRLTTKD